MICPSCGAENIQGEDVCINCGVELRAVDVPQPSNSFEQRLVDERLATLGAAPALTASPATPAAEVVRDMQQNDVGSVVVEHDGRVVGIFTELDALALADRSLDGVTIGELMTADPVVLRADDSIAVAIHKMAVGGFRHIPLVDNGRATRVVTARDVFRHILEVID
jgi:signal-transduction protein with cAMP-binding, CBS, and nucleotidyltransferase domain